MDYLLWFLIVLSSIRFLSWLIILLATPLPIVKTIDAGTASIRVVGSLALGGWAAWLLFS